jgi:hypothetical protein
MLSGCNIASRVVVNPDGSGTYSVILTVPNGTGNPGGALESAMKKAMAKSDVPLVVTPYAAGGESGAKATLSFQSLADFNAESAAIASTPGGLGITVARATSGWTFNANSAQGLVSPPGTASSGSTGGVIDGSALGSIAHLSVVVQLPGSPAENNATAVTHSATSSTFTWALTVGRASNGLQASTTFVGGQAAVKLASGLTAIRHTSAGAPVAVVGSNGTSSFVPIGGGAVLVVAFGAGLILLRRRGRHKRDVAAATGV